jgi:hypothetical protein
VILDSCLKDSLCVDVGPTTDGIHPKPDEPGLAAAAQMYIDPKGGIDPWRLPAGLHFGFDQNHRRSNRRTEAV